MNATNAPVATTYVITLPNRRQVSVATYVNAWQSLKLMDASEQVRGWDYFPASAAEILRAIRYGVHDRVNQRGGITIRKANETRVQRQLRRRVMHDCLWCGSPLGKYEPRHFRFCDPSCRRSYDS